MRPPQKFCPTSYLIDGKRGRQAKQTCDSRWRFWKQDEVHDVTQCVEVSLLVGVVCAEVRVRLLSMLLLKLASFWVLVSEDEVQFVILTTLIRPKHDGVRSLIHKLLLRGQTGKREVRTHSILVH